MPRACDLKKGNVVEINGDAYIVKHIDVKTPSARGAVTLYKVRFTNLKTKGNTGSAAIFIMLEEAFNNGLFKPGDKILLVVPESARFNYGYIQLTCM